MESTASRFFGRLDVRSGSRCLWAGIVLLGAVGPVAAAPPPREPVLLHAVSVESAPLDPMVFDLMTRELNILFAEAGVRVAWRRTRPSGTVVWRQTSPGGEATRQELRVVFTASSGRGADAGQPILASALPSGPAPTVWVYTPNVIAALDLQANTPAQAFAAQRALGVALGRVMAHELIHLLVPEEPHGTGVMIACIRLAELDHRRPTLDRQLASALTAAARSWRARGGAPQKTVASHDSGNGKEQR